VLANANAPAFLAYAPLSTMLTKLSEALSRCRLSRHFQDFPFWISNKIFIATRCRATCSLLQQACFPTHH
jgi:hypothetical protein